LGRIIIVAPDRDNSAVSHSLTMNRPLKVVKLEADVYTVDGTPTDCVALALKKILSEPPDLLVSGINTGANLGDDISYSGTVSAAIEATTYGIQSIAISVCGDEPFNFCAAMKVATCMAQKTLSSLLPANTLLNINVPSGDAFRNICITRQGRRLWENSIHETKNPRGVIHYWIGGGTPIIDPDEETDVQTVNRGDVSITPIHLDLTNHAGISYLRDNWNLATLQPKPQDKP
jgi:5'-nucleotidase